mgnify:CR=1 FL=1
MKFFVDTADVNDIRELQDAGLIDGVTTTRRSAAVELGGVHLLERDDDKKLRGPRRR